ncbi:hypothetical protein V8G54_035536 [Vigna mungo]|uniref:SWIM-type domain-containing protein n=1 Tax=Vigna mungo TaxID=3915 RepID=A0AAQ3MF66_VIGMU
MIHTWLGLFWLGIPYLDFNRDFSVGVRQLVCVEFAGRCRILFTVFCVMDHIEVVIHHGGKFVNEGCLKYEGEIETLLFDPDVWSYFVVVSVVKSLGYDGFKELWYSVGCGPVLDDRLEALTDGVGAMQMVTLAHLNGRVHMYVVHNVSEPEIIHMIDYNIDVGEEVAPIEEGIEKGGEGQELDEGVHAEEVVVGQAEEGHGQAVVSVDVFHQDGIKTDEVVVGQPEEVHGEAEEVNGEAEEVIGEAEEVVGVEVDRAKEVVGEAEEVVGVEVDRAEEVVGEAEEVLGVEVDRAEEVVGEAEEVLGIEVDENDVQRTEAAEVELQTPRIKVDSAEEDGIEVQADIIDVDRAESGEVEVEAEKDGEMDDVEVGNWSSTQESDGEMDNEDGLVDIDVQFDESESCSDLEVKVEPFPPGSDCDMDEQEIDDSKELSSAKNSDEDSEHEGYGHFPTFIQPKNMFDYNWELGTYFANKEDILNAIKSYAVENDINLKLVKNDKKRIRVICLGSKGECPWVAYFGFMGAINSWQLRTVVHNHTCSREHKVRVFNAKWLSTKLEKTVRENPNVKGIDIREKIYRKWNIAISKNMAYRAKTYASDEVARSFTEQYTRIFDYAHELLARNPGSTILVKVEPCDGKVMFQRFYACLKACKDSFHSCRPIIGLDGAFLKGRHHGELLTAVARDANDQMLPLVYAIVEVENKDTWTWFLELLIEDLGGPDVCYGLTVMSDQQKGLRYVVQDVIPGVAQRFCVRNLYVKFRKQFPGKNLKRLMWRAATTTHPQQWETEMRHIKEVNEDVFKHLIAIPPRFWSRSRFTTTAQSDTLVNNMSEAFSSVLVNTRTKPIITMLEDIRLYMMKRWAANRSRITEGDITYKELGSQIRHVSQSGDNFVVDIDKYTCSCRKWNISGIPCVHALTAMKFLNLNAEDYLPVWFKKSTYEEMYSSIIYSINGKHLWEVTQCPDVLPPPKRQLPGRPKKKRRLEQWELKKSTTKMSKGGLLKRCTICREVRHNKRNCPKRSQGGQQEGQPSTLPQGQLDGPALEV